MEVPLLVTRAAEDAERLVGRLRAAGRAAIAAPCLVYERAAVDLDPWRGRAVDLAVTSPRALPLPPLDPSWRVLALPSAARFLPGAVTVEGGAADIARAARPGPFLAVTSDLGGDELRSVRPDVVLLIGYRTLCPPALPDAAVAALQGPFDVLAASPSALRHFDRLAPGALARARAVLCHGRTTVAEARRLGAQNAHPWELHAPPPPPPPL